MPSQDLGGTSKAIFVMSQSPPVKDYYANQLAIYRYILHVIYQEITCKQSLCETCDDLLNLRRLIDGMCADYKIEMRVEPRG